jgi:hypothetical protein
VCANTGRDRSLPRGHALDDHVFPHDLEHEGAGICRALHQRADVNNLALGDDDAIEKSLTLESRSD